MKIGLFGIGLNTYWGQFEGLLDRLEGYRREIADRIGAMGVEVTDAGMVDDPTKADAAAALLKENDVELVFLYISTYALSSTVLPVVSRPECSGGGAEPAAYGGHRLRLYQFAGGPGPDDRRVAGQLPGVLGARGGVRVQPARSPGTIS